MDTKANHHKLGTSATSNEARKRYVTPELVEISQPQETHGKTTIPFEAGTIGPS